MRLVAHVLAFSLGFITLLTLLTAALIFVVAIFSFVLWTIPPVPTPETLYFAGRVLIAASALITLAYSFSNDYKQSVQEYLSK